VARDDAHDALRDILVRGTLHAWASHQPGARAMRGRGTTWATALPSGQPVAVRHSLHGGMLAAVTRDLFLTPTRAPHELAGALRLAAAGVRTPAVLGFAVYAATGPLCRADVVTELLDGTDLVSALRERQAPTDREEIAGAVRRLLDGLAAAGALHPDLNARNILLLHDASPSAAAVLDVDRVRFVPGAGVAAQNAARLQRSLRKAHAAGDFAATDDDVAALTSAPAGAARSA
jgi:tRNA A-37 threonylcarbamoyl transferase component Bud32